MGERYDAFLYEFRVGFEHLRRPFYELFKRKVAVAASVEFEVEQVFYTRHNTLLVLFIYSHALCYRVGFVKTNAVDFVAEEIRVIPEQVDCDAAPAFIYFQREFRREQSLKIEHDLPHSELIFEALCDFRRFFRGYALYVGEPFGMFVDYA